jgi:hypothetical protein
MSSRIDFDEPIPQLIERLKSEHLSFESKIVVHAVEEEARLMQVIMQNYNIVILMIL